MVAPDQVQYYFQLAQHHAVTMQQQQQQQQQPQQPPQAQQQQQLTTQVQQQQVAVSTQPQAIITSVPQQQIVTMAVSNLFKVVLGKSWFFLSFARKTQLGSPLNSRNVICLPMKHQRTPGACSKVSVCSRSNWNLEVLVFVECGKQENLVKNPRSGDKNQQQTQPTYGANSGN